MKLIATILSLGLLFSTAAQAKLNIITTTTTLRDISQQIGGDKVNVSSITKGPQDPHFVEAKPSYMIKARRADLVISVGLDLEVGWLPNIIRGARNPKIRPGQNGFLETGDFISPLEVVHGRVDRSQGDIHAKGNPHFLLDPRNGIKVAKAIQDRLIALDPENESFYKENFSKFKKEIESLFMKWKKDVAQLEIPGVVTHHKTLTYFLDTFGLKLVDTIEPKPGIPPTAKQILSLIKQVKAKKLKCLLVESFFETSAANRIKASTPVNVEVVPTEVESTKQATSYQRMLEQLVQSLNSCSTRGVAK